MITLNQVKQDAGLHDVIFLLLDTVLPDFSVISLFAGNILLTTREKSNFKFPSTFKLRLFICIQFCSLCSFVQSLGIINSQLTSDVFVDMVFQ